MPTSRGVGEQAQGLVATGGGVLKFDHFALSVLNSVCPMSMNTLFLSCLVALFVCSLGMAESPLKLEL
ncbi:MAG: hypothetical protein P8M65_08840, partial [Roseibacillus sp.]|nr:hypothetical protein [Roseibacillus sp.]